MRRGNIARAVAIALGAVAAWPAIGCNATPPSQGAAGEEVGQVGQAVSGNTYQIKSNRSGSYLWINGNQLAIGATTGDAGTPPTTFTLNAVSPAPPASNSYGTILGAYTIQAPSGYLYVSSNNVMANGTSAQANVFVETDCSNGGLYPGRVGFYVAQSTSPYNALQACPELKNNSGANYITATTCGACSTTSTSWEGMFLTSVASGGTCGDGVCQSTESCSTCPQDCGACAPVCGNGVCETGETCSTCVADCNACPPVCGNGKCETGETTSNCPQDCSCGSTLLNTAAATSSSPITASSVYGSNAGWFAFDKNAGTRWESVQGTTADPSYVTYDFGSSVTINGATIQWETAEAKNYEIDVANLDPSTGAMPIATSGLWIPIAKIANMPGPANRVDQWFTNASNANYNSALGALTGTLTQASGRFIRVYGTQRNTSYGYSIWEMSVYGSTSSTCNTSGTCGDGTCQSTETCSSCPQDCGACGPRCGDGVCSAPTETCGNCSQDCGSCGPVCGNGTCETGESCSTCSQDCGSCPARSISNNLSANANDGQGGGVTFETCSEGGQDATGIVSGSYLQWVVSIPSTGNYVVTTRSSATAAASYNVMVDGTQATSESLTSTGGAQIWKSFTTPSFNMTSGNHTLKIAFSSANQALEYVKVAAAPCSPSCGSKCGGPDGCGGTCANTCSGSQTCDQTTMTCVATGGCTMDSQCTNGQVCGHNGACMNVATLNKSFKRGIPFHFCGWNNALGQLDSRGPADLHNVMSGASWYYNWGAAPLSCNASSGADTANSVANDPNINNFADGTNGVEFVPMVWGFAYAKQLSTNDITLGIPVQSNGTINATTTNALPASSTFPSGFPAGTAYNCADANSDNIPDGPCFRVDNDRGDNYCSTSGACPANPTIAQNLPGGSCYECLHEVIDYGTLLSRIPAGSKYLLCGNEPMFLQQAALPPEDFATMWKFCEKVASARGLKLVAPAANYVGSYVKGQGGAGEGIPVLSTRQNTTSCTSANSSTVCPTGWGCAIAPNASSGVCQKEYEFLDYLDNFYHECEAGKHGRTGTGNYSSPGVGNCWADYNAMHVYTAGWQDTWAITSSLPAWQNHTDPTQYDYTGDSYITAQQNKAFWITEFSPEYAGSEANLLPWMNGDLNVFETSPSVFRYSWFQLRIADAMTSINLNSIACATTDPTSGNPTSTLTNAGNCYMTHPINATNDATKPVGAGYSPACAAQPVQTANCCDQSYYGLCVNGMVKSCTTTAQCGDANYACTNGYCIAKGCSHDADCLRTDTNFSPAITYVCDGITWTDSTCATVKWQGGCRPATSTSTSQSTAATLNHGNSPATCPQPGSN